MINRNAHDLYLLGEALAAKYLTSIGYNIVAKNFRCRSGEIDLIATILETLIFVEVKTRRKHSMANALANIGYQKQRKISSTAISYNNQNPQYANFNTRFDVIVIFYDEHTDTFKIHHFEDAFLPIVDDYSD